ncbi:MAG: dihydrofolate reductase family protein [Planctomycetota bacterium]
MSPPPSRVTIHMAASLDGFVARTDGRVDWMETKDHFEGGATLDPAFIETFLASIDCYVLGARTFEAALGFEAQGHGWAYGEKPTYVLSNRPAACPHPSVQFHSGNLTDLLAQLRPRHPHIWIGGGPTLVAECLRQGLADELRYTILPVLIGSGQPFFGPLTADIPLHLQEVKAYDSGMVELAYALPPRA